MLVALPPEHRGSRRGGTALLARCRLAAQAMGAAFWAALAVAITSSISSSCRKGDREESSARCASRHCTVEAHVAAGSPGALLPAALLWGAAMCIAHHPNTRALCTWGMADTATSV